MRLWLYEERAQGEERHIAVERLRGTGYRVQGTEYRAHLPRYPHTTTCPTCHASKCPACHPLLSAAHLPTDTRVSLLDVRNQPTDALVALTPCLCAQLLVFRLLRTETRALVDQGRSAECHKQRVTLAGYRV